MQLVIGTPLFVKGSTGRAARYLVTRYWQILTSPAPLPIAAAFATPVGIASTVTFPLLSAAYW